MLRFIDSEFKLCSSKTSFLKLSADAIFTLLENKSRTVEEIDIFHFLALWIKNQPSPLATTTKTSLLALVDLVAINPEHLIRFVRGSGLYEDKDICDAYEKQLNIEQDQTCLSENEEDQFDEVFLSETQMDNRSRLFQHEDQDEEEFVSKLKDGQEKMFSKEPSSSLHYENLSAKQP